MFQIGELILYGNTGVCRLEAIEPRLFSGKEVEHYKLAPLYGEGHVYLPVDSPAFMRKIMNKEQAMELIHHIPEIQAEPFTTRDQRLLTEHYRGFFQSHSSEDWLRLIRNIYAKGQNLSQMGKKMNSTDQQYFRRAVDLLHGELAAALNIPLEDVESFISAEVEKIS